MWRKFCIILSIHILVLWVWIMLWPKRTKMIAFLWWQVPIHLMLRHLQRWQETQHAVTLLCFVLLHCCKPYEKCNTSFQSSLYFKHRPGKITNTGDFWHLWWATHFIKHGMVYLLLCHAIVVGYIYVYRYVGGTLSSNHARELPPRIQYIKIHCRLITSVFPSKIFSRIKIHLMCYIYVYKESHQLIYVSTHVSNVFFSKNSKYI